jgi:serine/threonine protein kinase
LEAFLKIGEHEAGLLEDLLRRMFAYEPEKRMTAEEVVRHPWFAF